MNLACYGASEIIIIIDDIAKTFHTADLTDRPTLYEPIMPCCNLHQHHIALRTNNVNPLLNNSSTSSITIAYKNDAVESTDIGLTGL